MTQWTEYVEDDGGVCAWCDEPLDRGTIVVWRETKRGHEDCEAITVDLPADQIGLASA